MKCNDVVCFSRRTQVAARTSNHTHLSIFSRSNHVQSRQCRSDFWSPTVNIHKKDETLGATQLLIRAGYLRQAYAGIFHMLPLGLRVQEKLERLIDKHMRSVGASKVSLSSLSSQELWRRSGRLSFASELFRFEDRKASKWLLAPTHEEEITTLLANASEDGRKLPIRLYQISRKYRDEKRPRGGLLRGREFIMKDLYTFDQSVEDAHATYDTVREAYRNLLNELGVPYIEARADSGNMGGKLSHEYHFPGETGEDTVITCSSCDFARNEEFVASSEHAIQKVSSEQLAALSSEASSTTSFAIRDYISVNHNTLVRALTPRTTGPSSENEHRRPDVNAYAVKEAVDGITTLDTGIEKAPLAVFDEYLATKEDSRPAVYYVADRRVDPTATAHAIARDYEWLSKNNVDVYLISSAEGTTSGINLLKHRQGDKCPECQTGTLKLDKAIEIGHTFHLGTRYSSLLDLSVGSLDTAGNATGERVPVQMGCHGIGVSRLIAAVAASLSKDQSLIWPKVIAPYEVLICSTDEHLSTAHQLYDELAGTAGEQLDVLLDDRRDKPLGYKMKDAQMVGYPVQAILGKAADRGMVELICPRLKITKDVPFDQAPAYVHALLRQL